MKHLKNTDVSEILLPLTSRWVSKSYFVALAALVFSVSQFSVFLTMGYAAPGSTERVSVSSSGEEGDGGSFFPSINADGRYVAFSSSASNLVEGDSNEDVDVFVFDRDTRDISRVSVSSTGAEGNGFSGSPSISADGRYVAFLSFGSNLVIGDTNEVGDTFVFDRDTGDTSRVSVSSDGSEGNNRSHSSVISAGGRYVAFTSSASNLVAGDTNGQDDVFVHDRLTGTTTRVSVSSDGQQGNRTSRTQSISANGRFVGFYSVADNLVEGDINRGGDAFVHDRHTGTTTLVSRSNDGFSLGFDSFAESMSADGRYIAITGYSPDVDGGDVGTLWVHDQQTGDTSNWSGRWGQGLSISGDGRFVGFHFLYDNLAEDSNGVSDVFVHDRDAGNTFLVSISGNGTQGNHHSWQSSTSADGRYIAFHSEAINLLPGGSPFLLVSKESGQCLDITGGPTSQGNRVALQQYPCHGGTNQQFRVSFDDSYSIVAVHSDKCLDVAGVSQDDGAAINQYDCHGGPNQQWTWNRSASARSSLLSSSGFTTFRALHSQKCLTIPNPAIVGDEAVQATCDGSDNQQFQLQPLGLDTNKEFDVFVHERSGPVNSPQALTVNLAGSGFGTVTSQITGIDCGSDCTEDYLSGSAVALTATPDAGYVLTGWNGGIDWSGVGCTGNEPCMVVMTQPHEVTATFSPAIPAGFTYLSVAHSNKCLTIPEPGVVGSDAVQATCDGGENQQFIINEVEPDAYQIVSRQSGQCLDIAGGPASQGNQAVLQQYPCHGQTNQLFRLDASASTIRPVHSGKCIDIAGVSTADGAAVQQYDCHGGLNQQWTWME